MVLLSSSLLIQSLGLALLTISTMLVLTPDRILTSSTISILGSSMHVRPASYIPDVAIPPHLLPESHSNNPFYVPLVRPKKALAASEKELLALFGVVLGFLAVSMNILAIHLRYSKSGLTTWTNSEGRTERKPSMKVEGEIMVITAAQGIWQVLCAFNVVVSSGLVAWIYLLKTERRETVLGSGSKFTGEGLDVLANSVVFTFGLCNMLFWGYIFTVIKEERREVLLVLQKRQEEDEEDAVNKGETTL